MDEDTSGAYLRRIKHQGTHVREWVRTALFQIALGESFIFELIPVVVPGQNNTPTTGYVLSVGARAPMLGTEPVWTITTTQPFPLVITEEQINKVVEECVQQVRQANAQHLKMSQS